MLTHIKENANKKEIKIDSINCVQDHIHLLILLDRDQTISKVTQLIKGESSNWCNKEKITKRKFEWQDEYICLSVSDSVVDKVRKYIENQENHHKRKTFMDEYNEFKIKLGLD